MKTLIVLGLLLTYGCVSEIQAQSQPTRIVRLEVDGKKVNQSYRIYFLSDGRWIKAHKTSDGFTLPKAVQNQQWVTFTITFGKHRLEFDRVHFSNFRVEWVVGVGKVPFEEEVVEPDPERVVQQTYYILFEGEPGRQLVVTKWTKRSP